MLEKAVQPLGAQQLLGKGLGLVGQAGQRQARRTQRLQPLARTGINLGMVAVDGLVMVLVARPCLGVERFYFHSGWRLLVGR